MIYLIGYLATIFNTIKLVPEIKKALKTHHLEDVSWGTVALLIVSSLSWVLYGFHIWDFPIMISDGFNFIFSLMLAILKYRYSRNSRVIAPKTLREEVRI